MSGVTILCKKHLGNFDNDWRQHLPSLYAEELARDPSQRWGQLALARKRAESAFDFGKCPRCGQTVRLWPDTAKLCPHPKRGQVVEGQARGGACPGSGLILGGIAYEKGAQ